MRSCTTRSGHARSAAPARRVQGHAATAEARAADAHAAAEPSKRGAAGAAACNARTIGRPSLSVRAAPASRVARTAPPSLPASIRSFIHSSTHSLTRSLACSFIHSVGRSVGRSVVPLPLPSYQVLIEAAATCVTAGDWKMRSVRQ